MNGDQEAIAHLKRAIAQGKHWYIALLEAIGLWTSPEETRNGRTYCYLIAGEAFDWLLLAERLLEEEDGLVPQGEVAALLFHGRPPLELSQEQFRGLIGDAKYRAHLNYVYGVLVEEALLLATEEELAKEQRAAALRESEVTEAAYQRLYGDSPSGLLRRFRGERGYPQRRGLSQAESKEFTYWLFRYRLKKWDKARVASDTKKGVERLRALRG